MLIYSHIFCKYSNDNPKLKNIQHVILKQTNNLTEYIITFTTRKKKYLTGILFLLFLVTFPPNIIQKRIYGSWEPVEFVVQEFLNEKIHNPWKSVGNFSADTHFAKRDLRITPYLLGSILQIKAIKLFYLQILLFPLFIYLLLTLLWRFSDEDGLSTFYTTVALLFSYVGNSFFFDTLFLDSLGYFSLLVCFFFLRSPLLFPWLLVTFFIDERTIAPTLIFPLSIYLRYSNPKIELSVLTFFKKTIWENRTFWLVLAAILAYVFIRYILFQVFGLKTPVGAKNGVSPITAFKFGLKAFVAYFSACKATYFFVFASVIIAVKNKHFLVALWLSFVFLLISLVGLSVEDITRSVAYGFPVILVAFQYISGVKKIEKESWINITQRIALISLLVPTYTLLVVLVRIEAFAWLLK